MPKLIRYVADFETTTDLDDCRVWAYAICDVAEKPAFFRSGESIHEFFDEIFALQPSQVYFHNLKFDGDFILNWLLENDWEWTEDRRKIAPSQFATLISDDLKFYMITICYLNNKNQTCITEFRDSLKLLNMPVSAIAKTYGIEEQKLSIDYRAARAEGHEMTDEERAYIYNDVIIVAKGLNHLFEAGLTQLTTGSNALHDYRARMGKTFIKQRFPVLPLQVDKDLRRAYKGGFSYLNPKFAFAEQPEGIVLDVNSLYPWSMHSPNKLPFGRPVYYEGEYLPDKNYPLYIQRLMCSFDLKPGGIPCIQLKNSRSFCPTDYLTTSEDEIVAMTVTNIDLELIRDNYILRDVEYFCGWKFRATAGMFDEYIDFWTDQKIAAAKEKNAGKRAIAKLMLNSLYGKFATNPIVQSAKPVLTPHGVRFEKLPPEERDPVYLPVGEFITAIARNKTIRAARACLDRFIYADTDSLHIVGATPPDGLEIDDYALGAWKIEESFVRGKYLRAKSYVEEVIIDENEYIKGRESGSSLYYESCGHYVKLKVTVAGLPKSSHEFVTFDNFQIGAVYEGKLRPAHVAGGTVLVPTTFEIKA